MFRTHTLGLLLCALVATSVNAEKAIAGNFEFLAAPEITLNRVYRLNKTTGEIGACQYGLKDDTKGETVCYPAGEGAGSQGPGEYGLVSSRHTKESGVFRVNKTNGQMSICFVLQDKVICTPPG